MQITVKMQDSFSYPIVSITMVILLFLAFTFLYFILKHRENKSEKVVEMKPKNVKDIKKKYLKKLEKIEASLDNNRISSRKAYQQTSEVIRFFVFELTDINVQNYTLQEIEQIDMPILSELIREYYVPEFSKDSKGDIKNSIEKTRKVINKWN